jgi:hypothetical protein
MAEWTIAEVSDWLRSIAPAYAQYCAAFAENGVNGFTLLELEPEWLKELGVASPIHRTRLLGEIKRHRSAVLSASAPPAGSHQSTPKGLSATFHVSFGSHAECC